MSASSPQALPNGTRLRGGSVVVEKVLGRDDKSFSYQAYDVPTRAEITLREFFPESASRDDRTVTAPTGWSPKGFLLAGQKWSQSLPHTRYFFEENGTVYVAVDGLPASGITSSHATVPLTSLPHSDAAATTTQATPTPPAVASPPPPAHFPPAPGTTAPPPSRLPENIQPAAQAQRRPKFSWQDIAPDALRGAWQGAVAGALGGILLGALGSLAGNEPISAGAMRGLWALPIGALAGAFLAALRALPSSAPQLATASARTTQDQLSDTLSGAGKGALLGLLAGFGLFLPALFVGQGEFSVANLIKLTSLFLLCGAFAGGIVAFIRVAPRDRSRR